MEKDWKQLLAKEFQRSKDWKKLCYQTLEILDLLDDKYQGQITLNVNKGRIGNRQISQTIN